MTTGRTLLVVVLYRADASPAPQPPTLRCLAAALSAHPELLEAYELLIWDNSGEPSSIQLPFPFQYHHSAVNDGVSGAYNGALAVCLRHSLQWMLVLDEDTEVSAEFLSRMLQCRRECEADETIAAIAPLLYEKTFQLSPQRVLRYRNVPVPPFPSRVLEQNSFAANSGVMLRTSALTAIGGYSLDFWLDYSDIEMFHRLYVSGRHIYLAADLRLEHSMTMLDYDGRMTAARYSNFLHAEQAFFDLYRSPLQNIAQILRLCARVFRQRRYRNKQFSRLTLSFLLQRLRTSKASRLKQWEARKIERHASQPAEMA